MNVRRSREFATYSWTECWAHNVGAQFAYHSLGEWVARSEPHPGRRYAPRE